MSALKTERLLNLVICLLSTRQFLAKEQIRAAVPQYAECRTTEAFDRQFERDKEELREMGVPLQTGSHSAWFEDEIGYRIDRAAYALPAVSFEPDELAVLGLASRVWQQASLASAASRALLKLKASGVEPDESSLLGIEPRVRASEPAFEPLYAATIARRPVRFPYRAAGGTGGGQLTDRHVEPWGIVSWHGRWYLVAHDRDREATRVFRLSRVAGEVQALGEPGEVVVPEGVDFRAEVARLAADPPQAEALVRVRSGRAAGLRRRAVAAIPGPDRRPGERSGAPASGDDAGWDVLTVPYGDTEVLAEELAGLGADAVADAPAEVRAAVVRRLRATLNATPGATLEAEAQ